MKSYSKRVTSALTSLAFMSIPFALNAQDISNDDFITIEWLKDKPRSYAKDFYIERYLNKNITPSKAIEALGMAKYVNRKMFFLYAKKLRHDETSAVAQCMKAKAKDLVNTDSDCIRTGLSTFKATKLEFEDIEKLIEKQEDKYPTQVKTLKIISAPIPFTKLISKKADAFFETYNQCGSEFRANYFNYKLPSKTIRRLKDDKRFNQTIKLTITNPEMFEAQKAFFNIDDKGFTFDTTFLLAINAINHKKERYAIKYLDNAYKKAYYQFDKDNVLFWQYFLTGKEEYLMALANSWDVNIYSIYAKEKLGIEITNVEFQKIKEIVLENNETNASDLNDTNISIDNNLSDINKTLKPIKKEEINATAIKNIVIDTNLSKDSNETNISSVENNESNITDKNISEINSTLSTNIDLNLTHPTFDIKNQFNWIDTLADIKKVDFEKMKKYEEFFYTKDTSAHLAFVKERFNKYRKSYYITPYQDYTSTLSNHRKSLMYAIARQESRFIPSSISTARAMGIMQIMPFLSKSLAKDLGEDYNIYAQFEPYTNLRYANKHLDFLEARLNNPLFIAYAYNGGIGFTKRMIKKGLFKKEEEKNKYEPFLSMELVPYSETRKYGKKVLGNYYIYKKNIDNNSSYKLSNLLETIE